MACPRSVALPAAAFLAVWSLAAQGAEGEEERESRIIRPLATSAVQCQLVENEEEVQTCGAAGLFVPTFEYSPTEADTFLLGLAFAVGDALETESPFALDPWFVSVEDDTRNINGRPWSYVQHAWYRRAFQLDEGLSLDVTGGIIDAADYIDLNEFANDEYRQFLGEAFVNTAVGVYADYDLGGSFVLDMDDIWLTGVAMNVGENAEGRNYTLYGLELGHRIEPAMGEGNYRLLLARTTRDFERADGGFASRASLTISADQKVAENVGLFLRVGWQDRKPLVRYGSQYVGGVSLDGQLWGRQNDTIGFGYGYLAGGTEDIERTHVAEAYYRAELTEVLDVTLDVQYLSDAVSAEDGPQGFILGLRSTVEF